MITKKVDQLNELEYINGDMGKHMDDRPRAGLIPKPER